MTQACLNGAERLLAGHGDDRAALACGDEQLTRGELRSRVARAATAWRNLGLAPGGRVAVMLPDGVEWVVAWLGAVWAGGVAVGVNPRIPERECGVVFEEARFERILAESVDAVPPPWRDRVVALADGRRAVAAALESPPVPVAADDAAFWVQSSGTSGRPKAVVHAHRAFDAIAQVSGERLGVGPGDRLFSSSKLFFTYPLVNLLLAGLRLGAEVLLDAQWPTPESFADAVAARRPSVVFSVPSLYRGLLAAGLAPRFREAGVRLCVSAGEALPARLREAWQKAAGLPIADGYGASETLVLALTALPGDDGLRPSPGIRVRPLDEAAAERGAPVRLLLQAPTLALGYLDRPQAQADAFRGDAFCPADLFVRTPSGGWRFVGREDSLVKIRGRWVDLPELEERLCAGLSGVREAAAVCVPDPDGFDAVALFYAADDAGDARERLAARIAALPAHQRPAWVLPVEALPRTATGKLLRRQLADRLTRL
jgi:acyl-coenzyme A synthetase/AMP-(fatty) acid ligase